MEGAEVTLRRLRSGTQELRPCLQILVKVAGFMICIFPSDRHCTMRLLCAARLQ